MLLASQNDKSPAPDSGNPAPDLGKSLRRAVLRNIGIHLYRHHRLALIGLLVLTGLALWRSSKLEVEANLRSIAPPGKSASGWAAAEWLDPGFEPIYAIIKSKDQLDRDKSDAIARMMTEALDDPEMLVAVSVVPRPVAPSPSDLLPSLYPTDIARLRQLLKKNNSPRPNSAGLGQGVPALPSAESPAAFWSDIERRAAGAFDNTPLIAEGFGTEQASLKCLIMRLSPAQSSDELFYSIRMNKFLLDTLGILRLQNPSLFAGIDVNLYGTHLELAQMAHDLGREALFWMCIILVCLILLMLLAFRKAESLAFIGLPPLIGLVWSYGLIALLYHRIALLSAIIPFLLLAPGIEFCVQIYYRFTEELYREKRYYPALGTAYSEAGRGVFACSLTMIAIFAALYFFGSGKIEEFAIIGGIATFAMAASSLLVLPPLAAVKSSRAKGNVLVVDLYDFGLHRLSAAMSSSPRTIVVTCIVLTAYLAFFAREIQVDRVIGLDLGFYHLRQFPTYLQSGPSPAENPLMIYVKGDTFQKALEFNDQLYENLLSLPTVLSIGPVDSLSPSLPSLSRQAAIKSDFAALSPLMAKRAKNLSPFLASFNQVQKALEAKGEQVFPNPIDPSFIATIQKRILHANNSWFIRSVIYPHPDFPMTLNQSFAQFWKFATKGIERSFIRADSETLQNRQFARQVLKSIVFALIASGIIIFVALMLHFHNNARDALLVIMPLVASAIWTYGIMSMLQIRIGLYSLLTFPVVIGVALNQSIMLIQRLHDRHYASLRQMLRSGGRPIVLSICMLAICFGALTQTQLEALQEMASVSLAAITFSAFSTLVLVPALLQIRSEGGISAWIDSQED